MQQIVFGILGIGFGYLFLKYTKQIYEFSGSFGWAEKFFGMGGTVTALRLFGLVVMATATLYMFWLIP